VAAADGRREEADNETAPAPIIIALPGDRASRPACLKYLCEDRNRSRSRSFFKNRSRSIDVGKSEIVTALIIIIIDMYSAVSRNFRGTETSEASVHACTYVCMKVLV